MGPMRWMNPQAGFAAMAGFMVLVIGFMFLRRFMMGGGKRMGGPGKMDKWNRMGSYPKDTEPQPENSQPTRKCPSCGQLAQDDWTTCPHCGNTLAS